MSKADKRARKKENQAKARAAAAAAAKKQGRVDGFKRLGWIVLTIVIVGGGFIFLTRDDKETEVEAGGASTTAAPATTVPNPLPEGCSDRVPEALGNGKTYTEAGDAALDPAKFYTATIETSCGTIVAALDVENSPIGSNNFAFLAREGFFDGLTWHRAVTDFVIQGGDPDGTGGGGPGYSVVGELPPTGTYATGDLAWAKSSSDPAGTAGSQFFVTTGDPAALNSSCGDGECDYGYFGKVISGLDNAKKIESLSPGDGAPTVPMYIFSVTIEESATPPTSTAPAETVATTTVAITTATTSAE